MRGSKSSSSKSKTENLEKSEEPHLSGAYIRSLVKKLASSRTKDSSELKELEREGISGEQDLVRDGEKPHQPPQQYKKKVRRRVHTSKPYQERMINMAEARREIVSALKLHRAAMKQASERKQQEQVMESGPEVQQFEPEFSSELKSRRNPRIYASNSTSFSNNFPVDYVDKFAYSPGLYSPYSWPVSSIPPPAPPPPPPLVQENLDFQLPTQTLGLNLNLQDFNLETTPFHSSSIYSSSSPSTSSSPALSTAAEEIPNMGAPTPATAELVVEFADSGLSYPSMDDRNDSEGSFEFLKSMEMEIGPDDQKDEDFVSSTFDEVMEFPAWLNANDGCFHHVNDLCSNDYFQDPALPCMEIEEIEGIDGDWLA